MESRIWQKFFDEGVPTTVGTIDRTLAQVLEDTVKKYPDRIATIFEGKALTYAELLDSVERLATALVGMGVGPGDRVAVHLPNLPQTVISYYAVQRIGAIAVLTNPMYVAREIEHQFNDAGVKVAITLDAYWVNLIEPIKDKIPSIQHVIVTGIKDYLPFPKSLLFPLVGKKQGLYAKVQPTATIHQFTQLIAGTKSNPPAMPTDVDATANFQYTGGTTGVSKGAILTHHNLVTNSVQTKAWFPGVEEGGEIAISALPFFHSFGLTVCMNFGILIGATQILVPNPRDIKKLISLISKYHPTLFPAVPAMFNAINNYPGIENIDISSIKGCFSGSAPLPVEVLERFEKLTGGKITEGFGLSESSPVTHANPLYGTRKAGSIGIPISDTDARIVDLEEGKTVLGPNEDGELILAGPQIMKGYWNQPEETAEMLRDGWLHTGDIAKMDDDGFFYIVGRKKDMIIAGGYNIYPREIDEILYEHPKILEAAAVGIPDPKRGETVKAFVVVQPGETLTEEEVIAFCRDRLAPYKAPKAVEFRSELPKTTIGKVLRRVLRDEEIAKGQADR